MPGLLARERIVAPAGYDRWLVPPAALAIHLSIGQAYAYSVFNLPLTRLIGVTQSAPGDWTLAEVGWVFTLFFVVLGLSAALFGRWVEESGPRKAGVAAACCWGAGYFVAALAVKWHSIWLLYLGNGVIGGCGLGLGYISPVLTLMRWFPDRRGMATGLAIMGFGGGAMIGAPLADWLMRHFASAGSTGVAQSFLVLGGIYSLAMLAGAFGYRVPAPGWKPEGWTPPAAQPRIARGDVHVERAWKTGAFWLLWLVLCLNVTAGIGVLGQASPMIQEVFKGRVSATAAAGFVGLLSLFNIAGRIGWASFSDVIGRRTTYALFFLLGTLLYAAVPWAGRSGSVAMFVACFAVILTMYGGGFATIPAYLADIFGTRYVSAIHGRILTAWSTAGVLGPVLVNYIRQYNVAHGIAGADAYNVTMYVMAGLLVVGFVCNVLVRPLGAEHFLAPEPAGG